MKVLLTNDDGVFAEGIRALKEAFEGWGEVFVVAPDRERTAIAHALTLHRPLRLEQMAERVFAVDGTPVDCVHMAISQVMGSKPDLLVSGINNGPNMGEEVVYSGTVSAAFEATFLGIPAFAISLATRRDHRYRTAAQVALKVARAIPEHGLPERTFLNINVPNCEEGELKGFRITRLGRRLFSDCIIEKVDPRGKKYYWIGGAEPGYSPLDGSDFDAVASGYVSVTPLRVDLTDEGAMEVLARWGL